jgi:hypothetical protein
MARKTGYLASLLNIPPLIFRFQFNPDILSEKKSYKYDDGNFGSWTFSTGGATSFLAKVGAFVDDVKGFGPLLTNVKPLNAVNGEARTFAIDFSLDASNPGPLDGGSHYNDSMAGGNGGSIDPDLALLRAFMMPSVALTDLASLSSVVGSNGALKKPPECSLFYGNISLTCHMTDLNIKMISFFDDGKPKRADVSVSLKEQTKSLSTIPDAISRYIDIARSYGRSGIGQDFLAVTPIVNLFV